LDVLIKKNPKKKKQIVEFVYKFVLIEDIFVDKRIFEYSYKCKTPGCGICCFDGTAVTKEEISRISTVIEKIKPYLSPSNRQRLSKLDNVFYRKNVRKGLWRLRTWNSSCIFLMEDKLCAVHKYCLDNNINWIKFHFDLCVTYPLRISRKEDFIHIEEELATREYTLPCFNTYESSPSNHLIYTMKNVIIDRLGHRFWEALEKRLLKTINLHPLS
jgi:hypothetical protein